MGATLRLNLKGEGMYKFRIAQLNRIQAGFLLSQTVKYVL